MSCAPSTWYESDTPFLPLQWQATAVLDLLSMRGMDVDYALRGTRIFYEDVHREEHLISPQQYARLLNNTVKLSPAPEFSFLLGERLFPGHYGPFTSLLLNARDLHAALSALTAHAVWLSPLSQPLFTLQGNYADLVWQDGFGPLADPLFATESILGGWISYCRWLGGHQFPWQIDLPFARPKHFEYHELYFGAHTRYEQPVARLRIARDFLHLPWPRASSTAFAIAERQCAEQIVGKPALGFVSAVRASLEQHVHQPPSLTSTAALFAMSASTLKRKLNKHSLTFQQLLDHVRKLSAIRLLTENGMNSDDVARQLSFYDVSNFRRAFKRWTGSTPGELKVPPQDA